MKLALSTGVEVVKGEDAKVDEQLNKTNIKHKP